MLGAVGPSAAWYLTRSTGAVALVLLSLSVVLGVLDVERLSSPRWPRFAVDALHRNISLLVLAFLGLHIVASALDGFAPIPLIDAVVPFVGAYRPVWLGLGAVSFDLLLAVALTSVLRRRLGHRAWRATHWLAYAAWPVGVVHGLGTGSDTKGTWMLVLTGACVAAAVVALGARAARGRVPARRALRGGALAATAAFVLGLLGWLPSGPLGHGWARRSGTPPALLASTAGRPVADRPTQPPPSTVGRAFARSFSATFAGRASQGPGPAPGVVAVRLITRFGAAGRLAVEIDGQPAPRGGVVMSAGRVSLGTRAAPLLYGGPITALFGNRLSARVTRRDGSTLQLAITLAVDNAGRTVSGTLSGSPTAPVPSQ